MRGVTTRLAYLKVGKQDGDEALAREILQFPYVGEVCERLKMFEADRTRYPTVAAFFPEIVKTFQSLAAARS